MPYQCCRTKIFKYIDDITSGTLQKTVLFKNMDLKNDMK